MSDLPQQLNSLTADELRDHLHRLREQDAMVRALLRERLKADAQRQALADYRREKGGKNAR